MKKTYQKPLCDTVIVKIESLMISYSTTEAEGGTDAFSRGGSDWDDDEY